MGGVVLAKIRSALDKWHLPWMRVGRRRSNLDRPAEPRW